MNFTSEQIVLGGLLKNRSMIERVSRIVSPDYFQNVDNRILYSELLEYNEQIDEIDNTNWDDVVYFRKWLKNRERYQAIGGDDNILGLFEATVSGADAPTHAEIVKEDYFKRQGAEIAERYAKAFNNGSDLAELVSGFESEMCLLKADSECKNTKPILPLKRLSNVQPEAIEWQWENRFPIGQVLLPGPGSAGKTTFSAYIASRLTTGGDWADCKNTTPPGTCLYIGAEDGLGIIRTKLDAAGADVSKVVALDYESFFKKGKNFNLLNHADYLDKTIEDLGDVRAVFFDPLNGYLGKINSHNDCDARQVLIPLQNIARKHHITIYGLCHLNKKSDLSAVDRVLGSVAFVNAARAVWFITHDKESGLRYLTHEKSNYSIDPENLSFRIVDGCVAFAEGSNEKTADEILQGGIRKADSTEECIDWLKTKLQFNSAVSNEISSEARHCGFSEHALRTAKRTLNIQSKPNGIGGKWMLSLPETEEIY